MLARRAGLSPELVAAGEGGRWAGEPGALPAGGGRHDWCGQACGRVGWCRPEPGGEITLGRLKPRRMANGLDNFPVIMMRDDRLAGMVIILRDILRDKR